MPIEDSLIISKIDSILVKMTLLDDSLIFIKSSIDTPIWKTFEFEIFLFLSLIGIVISWVGLQKSREAARNATSAKEAANQVYQTTRLKSRRESLESILEKIKELNTDTEYDEARDLLLSISDKIHRNIGEKLIKENLTSEYGNIQKNLECAKEALDSVKPLQNNNKNVISVFYTLDSPLFKLSNSISQIIPEIENIEDKIVSSK